MKLVMTLLVRDEQDIVAENIDFHLAHGVDFVIAMDNRSVDQTPELLRKYERRGVLHYIFQQQDDYSQHRWVTSMTRLAATTFAADWVINNDADEFWYPEKGDLKQVLDEIPPSYDAVMVERSNFVPQPMNQNELFADVMTIRDQQSVNALGRPLPAKVCHRAHSDIEVAQGNHSVSRPGFQIAVARAPITIFHFPMRSYRQFANKIALGGAAYARNTELPLSIGDTWRHLYEVWRKGELEEFYRASVPDIAMGLRENRFVFDDRLKQALAKLCVTRNDAHEELVRSHPGSLDSPRGICSEPPEHDADHRKASKGSNGRDVAFEITGQPTIADPGNGSLDNRAFG